MECRNKGIKRMHRTRAKQFSMLQKISVDWKKFTDSCKNRQKCEQVIEPELSTLLIDREQLPKSENEL